MESFRYAGNYLVYIIDPTMVRPAEKVFKIKVIQRLESAILNFVFADIVFHKRAMSLIFLAECTDSVLNSFRHLEFTIGPTGIFSNKSSQVDGKCYFETCFGKYGK